MNAKESIDRAFLSLIRRLPLNKITIILVCEEAKVNRQTFYYYYHDVIDLLKAVLFQEIYDDVAIGRCYDNWEHGFLTTMRYLRANRRMFLNIYQSTYWNEIDQFLTECSTRLLEGVIDECEEMAALDVPPEKKAFVIGFYRIVFNGIMKEWVLRGAVTEPEEVLLDLQTVIRGTIPSAMRRLSRRNLSPNGREPNREPERN